MNLTSRMCHKTSFALAVLGLGIFVASPLFAQGWAKPDGRVPLPVDWSFGHVVYTQHFTPEQAAKMKNDPRLWNSWLLQGHVQAPGAAGQGSTAAQPAISFNSDPTAQAKQNPPKAPNAPHRDWSLSLSNGAVAPNMSCATRLSPKCLPRSS